MDLSDDDMLIGNTDDEGDSADDNELELGDESDDDELFSQETANIELASKPEDKTQI